MTTRELLLALSKRVHEARLEAEAEADAGPRLPDPDRAYPAAVMQAAFAAEEAEDRARCLRRAERALDDLEAALADAEVEL
jgi:hypothetical protein